MTCIHCATVDCKHHGDDYICTAEEISLTDSYYHTVNEGFKHFNICRMYEQSERAKQIEEQMGEFLKAVIR